VNMARILSVFAGLVAATIASAVLWLVVFGLPIILGAWEGLR